MTTQVQVKFDTEFDPEGSGDTAELVGHYCKACSVTAGLIASFDGYDEVIFHVPEEKVTSFCVVLEMNPSVMATVIG